eukprot:CAMPEP_0183291090 /NCGR_PEP_ID=MMETSP0160_2-20130417/632_1 /TAXON_ID=2839 ORGANISM="Odontella Sinensis, Strain Grunow 1884" /NCGR_SAMPLE_ID=MMETSP0160_2 /ASSEMBLY_ACC=CAM_ASM_000250 /LENGTH=128 /DNA_ID=CAMNT_0025451845 /DNA_START=343 /DNA_END=727 /DNA_ORIENTATION=-
MNSSAPLARLSSPRRRLRQVLHPPDVGSGASMLPSPPTILARRDASEQRVRPQREDEGEQSRPAEHEGGEDENDYELPGLEVETEGVDVLAGAEESKPPGGAADSSPSEISVPSALILLRDPILVDPC